MSLDRPKLRGKAKPRNELYPLGEIPNYVIINVGRLIVHRLAVGHADITGDDFGGIFASAISGNHFYKPIGVTDVVWNGCSWSVKTVKSTHPFKQPSVRLISGRNSPVYSYGIENPLEDVAATGAAVLNVWNERVNQSHNNHDDLRVVVLLRNMDTLEFTLFEYEAGRYPSEDYEWIKNKQDNLEGYVKSTDTHCFTWQPHGSQFTVIKQVPGSAYKFRITKRPGIVGLQQILASVGFDENWIERIR